MVSPSDLCVLVWLHQGEVVSFDAYHKRVKLRYDDGHEEWVAPQREQFRWLLPRAASAGSTAAMGQLMAELGAAGELSSVFSPNSRSLRYMSGSLKLASRSCRRLGYAI